jgi:hypothetical protein
MNPPDELSRYYAELLEGTYDCVDRVVLNAYFPMGQTGGGLRTWWRQLRGSDAELDDAHLRDLAGSFSRRVTAYCSRHGIPLIEAQAGERKHELAEPHVPRDPKSEHRIRRISVGYQFEHHLQLGAWKGGFCGIEFIRQLGRQLIRTSIAEVMQVHS